YSIKATSFTGLYIDGDRERIPYEGDAYINQLGHYCVDRAYSMARRTNEYFIKHPTWPTEWILHTVPMFYYDYMYTGNSESLAYYYENMKDKTLIALARKDGLISSKNASKELMKKLGFSNPGSKLRDLVDWPPGQKDTGWKLATPQGERDGYEMLEINTLVNAFYYQNMKLMAELAGYLSKEKDAIFYNQKAEQVKAVINDKLFDEKRGIYVDGENSQHASLHANMMPLAFGLVPQEYISTVVAFIKSRGMACSVYGAQYLMEGLYAAGEETYAFGLLTSTGDRSWYNMIRSGSTISMEAWDMKYKPNSDWNHAWGAVPANIIPRSLWGIQPTKPGFSQAIIKPQLANLSYAEIKVPTIRGFIKAEFKTNGNKREFSIQIPANMTCKFIIPSQFGKMNITHNKTKIKASENLIILNNGLNKIIIE
ncbi:MAG: alpha-L-rhamnosidase, partial [Bacteroidales bacterium]|nr:alpha-L-rhamnosidase [Bacteroidales bacterium]